MPSVYTRVGFRGRGGYIPSAAGGGDSEAARERRAIMAAGNRRQRQHWQRMHELENESLDRARQVRLNREIARVRRLEDARIAQFDERRRNPLARQRAIDDLVERFPRGQVPLNAVQAISEYAGTSWPSSRHYPLTDEERLRLSEIGRNIAARRITRPLRRGFRRLPFARQRLIDDAVTRFPRGQLPFNAVQAISEYAGASWPSSRHSAAARDPEVVQREAAQRDLDIARQEGAYYGSMTAAERESLDEIINP